ncbi:MAG: acyl-CoA thioesterase [Candidatus Latescibacterota bacterium]|nr:MAG: acyl-CoA thioesterase [Candidatus Latescibacterota bacterium]
MKIETVEQQVRYAETDRMQVVHHANYLLWFEIGRTQLLASAGYAYHELEASGTRFPVIEYGCRLIGSADYGDRVRIDTYISQLRSRTVEFAYEVFNGDKRIATGMTKHIAADLNQKPRRMDAALLDALRVYVAVSTEPQNR